MIHVILPSHLRTLACISGEVLLQVEQPVTQRTVLEALEVKYPALRGAIRNHETLERRPLLRVFACGLDLSHDSADASLPPAVAEGSEPLWIVGAVAGG